MHRATHIHSPLEGALSIPGLASTSPYKVRVRQQGSVVELFVHHSSDPANPERQASWVSFTIVGEVEIEIAHDSHPIKTSLVRPLHRNIEVAICGGTARLQLDRPGQLSIECDGATEHPLFLFADSPEKPLPQNEKRIVHFGPGLHEIGDRYRLESHTIYHLAPGAYVRGSFFCDDALDGCEIRGRGILDSTQPWRHPREGLRCNLQLADAGNLRVEGITLLNAGNFQIKAQTKRPDTTFRFENLKLIGWNPNSDGIHVSDMDWKDHPVIGNAPGLRLDIRDCFIRANDDAILCADGVAESEVSNCVIWDQGYGATFCLGWGGQHDTRSIRVHDCDVIFKAGNSPVFRARHGGAGRIAHISFENIRVEGSVRCLIGLEIVPHEYAPGSGLGHIEDVLFRNISLAGNCHSNWLLGHDAKHVIRNIRIENLTIGDQRITRLEDLPMECNAFVFGVTIS